MKHTLYCFGIFVCAAAVLLAGCGQGGSGSGGDLSGAVLLESLDGDAVCVRTAAAQDGTAAAIWVQDSDGSGRGVVYATTYTPGQGWSAPAVICGSAEDAACPVVAACGGGIFYAAWLQDYYNDGSSWVYRNVCATRCAAGSWGSIADLNENPDNPGAGDPALTVDAQGNVLFLWKQRIQDANQNIYSQYYAVQTETWPDGVTGSPDTLCQNDTSWGYAHGPDADFCPGTGDALVVWYQEDLSELDVHAVRARSFEPPSTWGATELLSDVGANTAAPRVRFADTGHPVIAWEQDDDADTETESVHAARPGISGGWVKRTLSQVSGEVIAEEIRIASCGNGTARIAWHQIDTATSPDQNSFGVYGCSHQIPASWTDASLIRLCPESHSYPIFRLSLYPRLAMDENGDSVILTTDGYMDVDPYLYFCSLECPQGSSWSSPEQRSDFVQADPTAITDFMLPDLDTAGPGTAFAVWSELEGGSWNVYAERFSF